MSRVERRIVVHHWQQTTIVRTTGKMTVTVDLPRARHDASNMEPTVQGSWPSELRFYRNRKESGQHIERSHLFSPFKKPDWTHTQS